MTCAVVATTRHPPQLVQPDYYALDLNYQDRLNKKQNTAGLAVAPTARFDAGAQRISVQLPAGMTSLLGHVKVYRSATTHDDFTVRMDNVSALDLPAGALAPGRWHLELDWTSAEGQSYFWETTVSVHAG